MHRARDRLPELRHHRLDPVDDLERVGARRLEDQQDLGRLGSEPGAGAGVSRAVDHGRDVPELDRRAVAVGDDDLAELVGLGQLLVDVEWKLRAAAFEIAGRLERALGIEGRADLREPQSPRRERFGIEPHLHGGLSLPGDDHLADARHPRERLAEKEIRVLVKVLDTERRRNEPRR